MEMIILLQKYLILKVYKLKFFIILFILLANACTTTGKPTSNPNLIPFDIHENWIFIKVSINGSRPYDFMFDTGINTTLINSEIADQLSLTSYLKEEMTDILGEDSLPVIKNNTLSIANFTLKNIDLVKTDLTHMERSYGKEIDGMIGSDILKKYIVKVNFETESLEIITKVEFEKNKIILPIIIADNLAYIPSSLILQNDTFNGLFLIDTGYNSSITFTTPFVNKNNLLIKVGNYYKFRPTGVLGKVNYSYKARIHSFNFGNYSFKNVPVTLSQSSGGMLASSELDGIIGVEILRKFNISFNYADKKIGLVENSTFTETFKVNCSGMELKLSDDKSKVIVDKVYENSPAEESKIFAGDEITEINGISASLLTLAQIKAYLRKSGEELQLGIKRNQEKIILKIKLRELV